MILREVRFRAKFHALHFFAASGCLYRNSIRGRTLRPFIFA
jgi:hypothetical protein